MNFLDNKQNRVVTIVCLTIAFVCIYFIQDDSLFRVSKSASAEKIGSFEQLRKDVRKKNIANYFWDDLKVKDSLIEGDSVFTGVESTVTVKLSSGQSIVVSPNSLIKFSYKGKKLMLDIPYGDVQLNNIVDDIVIADCGESINLNKDRNSVKLKKSERCGSLKIDTKSVINAKNFEARKPRKDIMATFTEVAEAGVLGKIEGLFKNGSGAVLSSPRLVATEMKYKATQETPQVLKWEPVEGALYYEVEVSSASDFTQFDKFKAETNQYTLNTLSPRIFYRVKAIGSEDLVSSYSELGRLSVEFPMIKLNKMKLVKEYKARNPHDRGLASTAGDLTWTKVPYAEKYVLELVDPKTKKIVKKTTTRHPASALEVPQAGTYNYQVHALDSKGRKISSSGLGQVIYSKVFNILAPIIKQGVNDKFYFFQKNNAKYVWLNWLPQGEATGQFRVEISRDRDFTNIHKSAFTTKSKLLLTDQVQAGDYFWRVRSEEADKYSDWSNVETFKIQINNNK
mgnify:CR=1 FL=1